MGTSAGGDERVETFPEDLTRFLYHNVQSIDELEILRVLGEDPERDWDFVALADAVQSDPQTVRAHLEAMRARGLLEMTARGEGLTCRYGAGTPELADMIRRLLQLYKERPVTMIKMVYEQARDRLRAFADSFRIRRED
jgi:DNA-binding MarR family transcriptional regulator